MGKYLNHIICRGLIFAFFINSIGPVGHAQAQEFYLPQPGKMVALSPAFNPSILKGIKVYPDNPFRFEFILDQGDMGDRHPERSEGSQQNNSLRDSSAAPQNDKELKEESTKLIKYFLASLTIPEKDLWVNLSPYEKDRIVPESFGRTEMGRDLLAEDYMLKQITSSLMYPEGESGKKFWKRVYEQAAKRFGTTNVPVNTFNKVWIVPEKAVVYENAKAGTAYVVEARLKVMLEEDYLSMEKHLGQAGDMALALSPSRLPSNQALNAKAHPGNNQSQSIMDIGKQIIKEIIIPALDHEVNTGANFAQLRQVYNSLILATWYKKKIKESILAQVYEDENKIAGVNIDDPQEKQRIYERYLQAFKRGVFSYIKEEIDSVTQQSIPRKYFSGGVHLGLSGKNYAMISGSNLPALSDLKHHFQVIDLAMMARDSSGGEFNLMIAPGAIMPVQYSTHYFSPEEGPMTDEEIYHRNITLELREENPDAVIEAAGNMKVHVGPQDILVPIPNAQGSTKANLILADKIAELSGAQVKDILSKIRPTESQRNTRHKGLPGLMPEELGMYALNMDGIDKQRVVFIDNLTTTGATLRAAYQAVGGGRAAVVYAKGEIVIYPKPENSILVPAVKAGDTHFFPADRRYGAFLIDVDGTLDEHSIRLIPKLLAKGYKVGIATQRAKSVSHTIDPIIALVEDKSLLNNLYVYQQNGDVGYRVGDNKIVLPQRGINKEDYTIIMDHVKGLIEGQWKEFNLKIPFLNMTFVPLGNIPSDKREAMIEEIRKMIPTWKGLHDVYEVFSPSLTDISISPHGVNKGRAARSFSLVTGLPQEEILKVGNMYMPTGNDYPMLILPSGVGVDDPSATAWILSEFLDREPLTSANPAQGVNRENGAMDLTQPLNFSLDPDSSISPKGWPSIRGLGKSVSILTKQYLLLSTYGNKLFPQSIREEMILPYAIAYFRQLQPKDQQQVIEDFARIGFSNAGEWLIKNNNLKLDDLVQRIKDEFGITVTETAKAYIKSQDKVLRLSRGLRIGLESAAAEVNKKQVISQLAGNTLLKDVVLGFRPAALVEIPETQVDGISRALWGLRQVEGASINLVKLGENRYYAYDEYVLKKTAADHDLRLGVTTEGLEFLIKLDMARGQGYFYDAAKPLDGIFHDNLSRISDAVLLQDEDQNFTRWDETQGIWRADSLSSRTFEIERTAVDTVYIATMNRAKALRRQIESTAESFKIFNRKAPVLVLDDSIDTVLQENKETMRRIHDAYGVEFRHITPEDREREYDHYADALAHKYQEEYDRGILSSQIENILIRHGLLEDKKINRDKLRAYLVRNVFFHISGVRNRTFLNLLGNKIVMGVDDDAPPVTFVLPADERHALILERQAKKADALKLMLAEISKITGEVIDNEDDFYKYLAQHAPASDEVQSVIDKYFKYDPQDPGLVPLATGEIVDVNDEMVSRQRYNGLMKPFPRYMLRGSDAIYGPQGERKPLSANVLPVDVLSPAVMLGQKVRETHLATMGSPLQGQGDLRGEIAQPIYGQARQGLGSRVITDIAFVFNGHSDGDGLSQFRKYLKNFDKSGKQLNASNWNEIAQGVLAYATDGYAIFNQGMQLLFDEASGQPVIGPSIGGDLRIEEPPIILWVWSPMMGGTRAVAYAPVAGGQQRELGERSYVIAYQDYTEVVGTAARAAYEKAVKEFYADLPHHPELEGLGKHYQRLQLLGAHYQRVAGEFKLSDAQQEDLIQERITRANMIGQLGYQREQKLKALKDVLENDPSKDALTQEIRDIDLILVQYAQAFFLYHVKDLKNNDYNPKDDAQDYFYRVRLDGNHLKWEAISPRLHVEIKRGVKKASQSAWMPIEGLRGEIDLSSWQSGIPLTLGDGRSVVLEELPQDGESMILPSLSQEMEKEFLKTVSSKATDQIRADGEMMALWPDLVEAAGSLHSPAVEKEIPEQDKKVYAAAYVQEVRKDLSRHTQAAQDFLRKINQLDQLEDPESKAKVMEAIDRLAAVYGLNAEKTREIKESVLVTKVSHDREPYIFGKEMDLDLVIQHAKNTLTRAPNSMFLSPASPSAKSVIIVDPTDGESGIVSEVGHLFLAALSGSRHIDHAVHEAFDFLASYAIYPHDIKEHYPKIAEKLFTKLAGMSLMDIYAYRDSIEETSPRQFDTKLDGIMVSLDLQLKLLGEILGDSKEASDLLREDPQVLPHALGYFLSQLMINGAGGSVKKAIIIAKHMLRDPHKEFWLKDYELFKKKFEEVIADDDFMRSVEQDMAMAPTGGIDLTSDKAFSVQNNGQAIKFNINPAMLAQLRNAPGFVPVIITIRPLRNLRAFLGV